MNPVQINVLETEEVTKTLFCILFLIFRKMPGFCHLFSFSGLTLFVESGFSPTVAKERQCHLPSHSWHLVYAEAL